MSTSRFTLLRKSANREPDFLIDIDRYENGQDVIRLASKYRTVVDGASSYYYEGLLEAASGMDERLPVDTVYKEQGDCVLTLLNRRICTQEIDEKFSDLLNAGLSGAKVVIRQFYDGCDWADVEDEIIYTGWVITEQTVYDENGISLTISPYYKKHSSLPPYRMVQEEYSTMDPEGENLLMPLIIGKLHYEGKKAHNGADDMDTLYGGAVLLSSHYIYKSLPDYRLLVAGHQSFNDFNLYKDLTKFANPQYYNDDAGGPNWRIITTLEVDIADWDADADWSCDTLGIYDSGGVNRDPVRMLRAVLKSYYGMSWADSDQSEIDNTSALLTFQNHLWTGDLCLDGRVDSETPPEQYFTKFMGQIPLWIYRGRNGKFFFKKWERRPTVDYTDCALSFEDHVLKDGFEAFYSSPKGPNITMPFWPNLGRDLADDVCRDGYFQRAFVQCTIQDSGYALDEDLTDSELEWNITGSGTQPVNNDLVLVGREICEVRLPSTPTGATVTVWRRGGNGTDAVEHSTGDRIYIIRTNSSNGRNLHDQMGDIESPCKALEIYEDATYNDVIEISPENHAEFYKDAERLADNIASQLNNALTNLQGTYACEWDPLTNLYHIYTTDSKEFKVKIDQSDNLAKVIGFWVETSMGTSHYGDQPARKRECQAAYDLATFRNHAGWETKADWIVGDGLDTETGGVFGGDLTPIVARDYRFDIAHRPMRRVKFRTTDRFINLTLGKIFEFDTDINDYLLAHGTQWTDLNWRVINIRHIDIDELEFIAEEAM